MIHEFEYVRFIQTTNITQQWQVLSTFKSLQVSTDLCRYIVYKTLPHGERRLGTLFYTIYKSSASVRLRTAPQCVMCP